MLPSLHKPTGHWYPWILVLVFIPVIIVNGFLVHLALRSNTGLVSDRAFDTGASYNDIIAAGRRQAALGWSAAIDAETVLGDGNGPRVQITVGMSDGSGNALDHLILSGRLFSPVDPQADVPLVLSEIVGGRYRQTVRVPRSGQWEIQMIASDGPHQFAIEKRILVQ